MKLWILRPMESLTAKDNPWEPWYDKTFGFVVRADTEEQARQFAHEDAGDENRGEFMSRKISGTKTPWLDVNYSTCRELTPENGPTGVVMKDFAAA